MGKPKTTYCASGNDFGIERKNAVLMPQFVSDQVVHLCDDKTDLKSVKIRG